MKEYTPPKNYDYHFATPEEITVGDVIVEAMYRESVKEGGPEPLIRAHNFKQAANYAIENLRKQGFLIIPDFGKVR